MNDHAIYDPDEKIFPIIGSSSLSLMHARLARLVQFDQDGIVEMPVSLVRALIRRLSSERDHARVARIKNGAKQTRLDDETGLELMQLVTSDAQWLTKEVLRANQEDGVVDLADRLTSLGLGLFVKQNAAQEVLAGAGIEATLADVGMAISHRQYLTASANRGVVCIACTDPISAGDVLVATDAGVFHQSHVDGNDPAAVYLREWAKRNEEQP